MTTAAVPDQQSPPGMSARAVGLGLLLVGALAVAVVTLVLLYSSPRVEVRASPVESDGTSTGEDAVTTEVVCVPTTGGTKGFVRGEPGPVGDGGPDDQVRERSGGVSTGEDDRGIEDGEVTALCDRARTARVAIAAQTGFVALVLLGASGLVVVRRRPAA